MLRGWALSLACVGACVKVPEFERRDGGGSNARDDAPADVLVVPSGVSATTVGTSVVLANEPLVRLTFSPAGFHFPSSLLVGGRELIVTPTTACADERAAGIALYPALRIDGATPASAGSGSVQVDLAGPGVAKVALDWTASFPCGGSTATANGRTTFTMFGDGRINRSDVVRLANQPVANDCDCGGNDDWYLTSYFTFARDEITNVVGATPASGSGTALTTTACASGNGFQMGMAWRTGRATRVRLPQGAVSGGTIAWVEDFETPAQTLAANFEGAAQTTWWPSPTANCTELRTRVEPYQANSGAPLPTLRIDGGAGVQSYGVALDGIFGGETAQSIAGGLGFGNTVTLTTNVALAGFALWLDIGAGSEIASVHKAPTEPTTTWYSVQTPPSKPTHRVLWFPDGLSTSDTITITTQQ